MYEFARMTEHDVSTILRDKRNVEIEIPSAVTRFDIEIPNVDFSNSREVPPTSAALGADVIARVLMQGDDQLHSKYIFLVLAVYALRGRIFYTRLSSGSFKAEVTW